MRMWAGVLAAAMLLVAATGTWAQDRLAVVRALYLQANYEQALELLTELQSGGPAAMSFEAYHYRALCLLALSRTEQAEAAMTAAVEADPFFVPIASEVPPRVTRMYADVRQRMLPLVARRKLTEARERHQDGERQRAIEGFDSVLKLLADPSLATRADLSDLRLAAEGLAELARAQLPAPASAPVAVSAPAAFPPPGPAAAQPVGSPPRAGGRPAAPAVAAAAPRATPGTVPVPSPTPVPFPNSEPPALPDGVTTQPVAIAQALPRWVPPDRNVARQAFSGSVYIAVNSLGTVTGARMVRSVFPSYDAALLEAARGWRFRPATRNGVPIDGGLIIEINLRPPAN